MEKAKRKYASIFELDGIPQMSKALPLALQHVVAMIVGCVTPAIIVAGVAGLDSANRVMLIQSALIVSAISTFLQLFPIGKKGGFRLGSGLPVIMGVSFAYVASMQAIAADTGIAAIFGAQIVGGIIAVIIGFFIDKIRKVFPPLVTGTVVFTIGLSLYPTAVNYMAGGSSSANYGHWTNWLVAFITLAIVTFLNHFTKGFVKLASILIGIICGYIIAACFGMVDLTAVAQASFFQAPQIMHFGIKFEPSSCIAIGLLFAINAIQAIGDFTATTTGSMDREPTDKELKGAIVGYGCMNVVGAFLGGLPTASYSQNVGIVTTTKVINRPWNGCRHSADRRSGAEILRITDNHSAVCTWWCNHFRICFYRNDRYQTDHHTGDELQKYIRCRSGCSTWCWCNSGFRISCNVPGMGNNCIRKNSGCYRNSSSCILKSGIAERKTRSEKRNRRKIKFNKILR